MITPQEKALQLMTRFQETSYKMGDYSSIYTPTAKHHALICVDETIRTLNEDIRDLDVRGNVLLDLIEYWREVKQEIEKL